MNDLRETDRQKESERQRDGERQRERDLRVVLRGGCCGWNKIVEFGRSEFGFCSISLSQN